MTVNMICSAASTINQHKNMLRGTCPHENIIHTLQFTKHMHSNTHMLQVFIYQVYQYFYLQLYFPLTIIADGLEGR